MDAGLIYVAGYRLIILLLFPATPAKIRASEFKSNTMLHSFSIATHHQQLIEITGSAQDFIAQSGLQSGLLTLFIRHTSASLIIQENADPSVQTDLITWMNQLVPENNNLFTHTSEGPDDMPAHIKSMLTQTSVAIPFDQGHLMLGTWQGVFLFEHRRGAHQRYVIAHTQA